MSKYFSLPIQIQASTLQHSCSFDNELPVPEDPVSFNPNASGSLDTFAGGLRNLRHANDPTNFRSSDASVNEGDDVPQDPLDPLDPQDQLDKLGWPVYMDTRKQSLDGMSANSDSDRWSTTTICDRELFINEEGSSNSLGNSNSFGKSAALIALKLGGLVANKVVKSASAHLSSTDDVGESQSMPSLIQEKFEKLEGRCAEKPRSKAFEKVGSSMAYGGLKLAASLVRSAARIDARRTEKKSRTGRISSNLLKSTTDASQALIGKLSAKLADKPRSKDMEGIGGSLVYGGLKLLRPLMKAASSPTGNSGMTRSSSIQSLPDTSTPTPTSTPQMK